MTISFLGVENAVKVVKWLVDKIKRGISVIFVSVLDLLMDIRKSFGTGRTAVTLCTVQKASCLVLDDLVAERMSEWVS